MDQPSHDSVITAIERRAKYKDPLANNQLCFPPDMRVLFLCKFALLADTPSIIVLRVLANSLSDPWSNELKPERFHYLDLSGEYLITNTGLHCYSH